MPNLILLNAPGPQGGKGAKGDKGDPGPAGPAGSALSVSGTGFVHWSGTGADPTARAVNLASNGAGGDVTGLLATTNISTTSTFNGRALMTRAGVATWDTLINTDLPHGTDGQILVTVGTTPTWTSLISLETTHGRFTAGGSGTDYKTVIGPLVGSETAGAALWLLPPATSPNANNPSIQTDGTHTILGATGVAGSIYFFNAGNGLYAHINSNLLSFDAVPLISFARAVPSPGISQDNSGLSTTAQGQNFTISPQSGGATSGVPGNFVVNLAAPNGGSAYSSLLLQAGGTTYYSVSRDAAGDVLMSIGASLSTMIFQANGSNQGLYFQSVGVNGLVGFEAPSVVFYDAAQATVLTWNLLHSGATNATIAASVAGFSLIQSTQISDAAVHDIFIVGQGPFASASTNKSPGNIILKTPLPVSGANFFGGVLWERGDGTVGWRLGYYGGPDLTYTCMWFEDAGSAGGTNYAFLGTATRTDLNAASSLNLCIASAYQINIAGTTSMQMTTNASVTGTFTVGTNLAGAKTLLVGDAASTILTLSTLAELSTSLIMDPVSAPSAPAGNKVTVYVDASDGGLYAIDTNSNIYQLVP